MVRFLDIKTFGEFESMVSIFNILGVLTAGFALFLTKEISEKKSDLGYVSALGKHTSKRL
jgi:O-antigen/teichoic acid export membrane protein